MPWDYKTNKPDSVKYLHPKIQRKAIAIANRIVENGGDEGMAIAVGIKKAKGLVKLAASPLQIYATRKKFKKLFKAIKKNDPEVLKELVIPQVIQDEISYWDTKWA